MLDVRPLTRHPRTVAAVDAAREACAQLRWLPAMRRRSDQVRVEACVRAAAASAELDGARLPLPQVRALVAPAGRGPGDGAAVAVATDPVTALVLGALRVTLDAHPSATALGRSPRQVMARMHALAGADLVADRDGLGRPATGTADRLELLSQLVLGRVTAPTLVVAALVDAEITLIDAFPPVSGVVARGLARAVVVQGGLDPSGVVVPERHALADRDGREQALAAYREATGGAGPEGAARWVEWWGEAVVAGAREAVVVAEHVMAGRLT